MINLLIIYKYHVPLNYNKLLIIKSFNYNKDLLLENNIKIEFFDLNENNFLNINFEKYKNYFFWLHQKVGSQILIKFNNDIKKNNIKTIFWMDDLHFPVIDRFDKEKLDNESRFVNCNLIISPSIDYFININSNLINKSEFLFYFFDENIINNYYPNNFDKRINKILLSGKINNKSYLSRKILLDKYKKNKILYDYLEHPGYDNFKHSIYHLKYYEKLSQYKACILGLANFPINFLLAKVIEILGCGCLGIFQKSDLYFKRLGLIENVHYISFDIDNISDNELYKIINSNNCNKIALNGYNFIKNYYNSKKFIEKVINIIYNNIN